MRGAGILPLLIAFAALGAESDHGAATVGEGLKAGMWERELPEMGRVMIGVLTTGNESFLFMPPARWQIEQDGDWAVRLISPERGSIWIRLLSEAGSKTERQSTDQLRQRAQARLQGSKIMRETTCYTEAESGPGFDLEWRNTQGVHFTARIAFLQVGGRAFEFCLLTPSVDFTRDLDVWTAVLTSFQVSRPGTGP